MAIKYLESDKVKAYPTAYRGQNIDPEAFFTSEHNITSSGGTLGTAFDSFVKEVGNKLIIVINGYRFEVGRGDLTNLVGDDWSYVYGYIRTVGTDGTFDTLVPYESGNVGDVLDTDGSFKGLALSSGKLDDSNGILILKKQDGSTWGVPKASKMLMRADYIAPFTGGEGDDRSIRDIMATNHAYVGQLSVGADQASGVTGNGDLGVAGSAEIAGNLTVVSPGKINGTLGKTLTFNINGTSSAATFNNTNDTTVTFYAPTSASLDSGSILVSGTVTGHPITYSDIKISKSNSTTYALGFNNSSANHLVISAGSGVSTSKYFYAPIVYGTGDSSTHWCFANAMNNPTFYVNTCGNVTAHSVSASYIYPGASDNEVIRIYGTVSVADNLGNTLFLLDRTTSKATFSSDVKISGGLSVNKLVSSSAFLDLCGTVSGSETYLAKIGYDNSTSRRYIDLVDAVIRTSSNGANISTDTSITGTLSARALESSGAITATGSGNIVATSGNIVATSGDISAPSGTVTAQSFTATSDRRLKENIEDYHPLKSILDLPIKQFDYVSDGSHHIGCIAQELQEIAPELVHEREDGMLGIEETKLVYLLIDEVRKLRSRVEELERGKE